MGEPSGSVDMIGMHGGAWFGAAAGTALAGATCVVGASRHLRALPDVPGRLVEVAGPLDAVIDRVASWRDGGQKVALVVSGDPGFFGLVRLARARLGQTSLTVHPAPSSVSLAFARAGLSWDDALVVSAHGRPAERAAGAVLAHDKVAVLVSPEQPPQLLGRLLLQRGCPTRRVVVASRLGEADETVWSGDLEGLASGEFDPVSVVLLVAPDGPDEPDGAGGPGWAWGLPDQLYAHRDGMITHAEVRAVALGKLRLPTAGVLWDVGAGSGSVAAECARLAPGLRVYAVERDAEAAAHTRANTDGLGVSVVGGEAPAALAGLPDPDRVFVGGGGIAILDAALTRLRDGGTIVATYAALDRASTAASRLDNLVQVAVSRGVPIGPGGAWRLQSDNPVFVCWGPER